MCYTRFLAVFDNHGDKCSPDGVEKMFEFKEKHWKPKIVIHGGDNFDFRAIRKKASEEERRESMITDYNAGVSFLKRLRPTYFLRGNHDQRLWDLAQEDRGIVSDYAFKGTQEITALMESMKCKMLPYDKRKGVLRLGHLKVIHGYLAGVTAARRTAQVFGSVIMGHGHAIQQASIEGLEQRTGMMCGCLCDLSMEYVRASVGSLVWEHGWAYGIINEKTGSYHVWTARKVDGKWVLPSDIVTL
jgi:hypothetical protein